MLILLLKLLLAHLVGDFVLQTKQLILRRGENVLYLLLHAFIHVLLLFLVFFPAISAAWFAILSIGIAHLAIDSLKVWAEKRWPHKPVTLFVTDQALHIAVIIAVVIRIHGFPLTLIEPISIAKLLLYLIAFIILAVVSPIFLRLFFTKWNQEQMVQNKRTQTLFDAGMLIGIMERLMIVFFIQLGFLEGIGFLLAAKSIFRFGDLTNAKDTKFTEYVLVGTLTSFLIAIAVGYALQFALNIVV